MLKVVLACLAMLLASLGVSFAQGTGPGALTESAASGRQTNLPVAAAGANNNNNVSAAPMPGPTAPPHPGEMVLRFGGRVNVEAGMGSSNVDSVAGPRTSPR